MLPPINKGKMPKKIITKINVYIQIFLMRFVAKFLIAGLEYLVLFSLKFIVMCYCRRLNILYAFYMQYTYIFAKTFS